MCDSAKSPVLWQSEILFLKSFSQSTSERVWALLSTLLATLMEAGLTWHCEVLSVDDLVLSVVELVVVLLGVAVQVLQVGHHRHAPPRVPGLGAGGDGHGQL